MNCKKCHHTQEAHESSEKSKSLVKSGKCLVTTCVCNEFIDPIERIDEELM